MGSFLGYIRLANSNQDYPYGYEVQIDFQFASSEPSATFSHVYQVNGLTDIIGSNKEIFIDDTTTDINALIEIEFLKSLLGSGENINYVNGTSRKYYNPTNFGQSFPAVFNLSNRAILGRTYLSSGISGGYWHYEVIRPDLTRWSWTYSQWFYEPYLALLAKIGSEIYFCYHSAKDDNNGFHFILLDGWGNASIYQSTTGDYLQIEPFSSPRNIRPYEIQYKVKYSGEYIDNSEVRWELYLHQDSDTPVENTDNYSLNNGVLRVGMFAPTSIFVKAIYNEYYAWASSSSIFIPYNPGGTTGGSGATGGLGNYGGGTFGGGGQSSSDDIASTIPVGGANNSIGASSMLYTRYLLSQADLDFIGEWLWNPSLGLNIAKTFVSLAFGSPIDAIISVYAYPFSIGGYLQGYSAQQQVFCYGGARAAIAGTAHMAYALLNNAVSFNWGSLKIDEYWGNFLDYAPHTTIELYLPWGIGFVSLDPNQVMGRTITITTNIDLTKGTCVHNIFDDLGSVIGTYSGQCAKQLPMTSLDNASKIAGITAAAVGTIASAAVGVGEGYRNATGGDPISFTNYGGLEKSGTIMRPKEFNKVAAREAFKQGTKAALASAAALGVSPSHVQRNGSFSDSSAFLGVQYPYIIISRPTQSVPEEYGHHYGYPSNIYHGLRYLSGYTEIGEIHLTGIPCTESELKELDSVLKGGVLF